MEVDSHAGIHRLIGDLNRLYREQPAMHQYDHEPAGFRWIDCHDSDQSILGLQRLSDDPSDTVICILNFTPVPRYNYRIGVPAAQTYDEILNSDSSHYGGSNLGNGAKIPVQSEPWMGFNQSLSLTLPPLSAIFLKPVNS